MYIMEKVNDLVELITKNETLKENFKKDPVKVVKDLLAKVDLDKLNLDDETVEKLTAAVKGNIAANIMSFCARAPISVPKNKRWERSLNNISVGVKNQNTNIQSVSKINSAECATFLQLAKKRSGRLFDSRNSSFAAKSNS